MLIEIELTSSYHSTSNTKNPFLGQLQGCLIE